MPETWTGNLIGKMHNKDVTYDELAEEMGVTKSYVSMILNGHRRPPDIRNRMEVAFNSIIQRRNGVTVDELLSDQGEG
ncbi:helix-turn-helix domain-containing protein [Dysosmobacter welbionis]